MSRQAYGLITFPSVVILTLAPLVEALFGLALLGPTLIAVLLTWPVACFSLWWMRRLSIRQPNRAPIGMIATALLRMTVAFGGGCLIVFSTEREPTTALVFWLSIVVAYLSTLAAEVFVLAKPGWVGRGGVSRKG